MGILNAVQVLQVGGGERGAAVYLADPDYPNDGQVITAMTVPEYYRNEHAVREERGDDFLALIVTVYRAEPVPGSSMVVYTRAPYTMGISSKGILNPIDIATGFRVAFDQQAHLPLVFIQT